MPVAPCVIAAWPSLAVQGSLQQSFFYPKTVTWASGVNIAVVEVDRDTGKIDILKYVFVHDCGLPLNPLVVDGQISGGFAQGLGIALGERNAYDDEGQGSQRDADGLLCAARIGHSGPRYGASEVPNS